MGSVAVCCGFNQYEHVPSLARAMNDAVHPYAELTKNRAFHADPRLFGIGKVFTQKTTSAEEVLAAFASAARSSAELVWFSFSGHAMVSRTGELRLLLPEWDGEGSDHDQRRRSIAASDLDEIMRPHLAGKKFVVVLDACFSGAFGGNAVTRDTSFAIESRIASAGAVVISACARDQLASDGRADQPGLNGTFTSALIEVLRDRIQTGRSLSVIELFLETKRKIKNGQLPTLYANGLTDDFVILADANPAVLPGDIIRMSVEVPRKLENELVSFLNSVVAICRAGWVGLVRAESLLERLAGEFQGYDKPGFVVPGTNANVVEAYEQARDCIIGCTTPRYFDEWRRSGLPLLTANELFIKTRGGRVVRFFFMRDDFQNCNPGGVNVIRDHVKAGIHAVIVHVDSFGSAVLQAVFNTSDPRNLSALECAFVDGKVFLKTRFIADEDSEIEIDQRPTRCQYEYKARLQPFLRANHGRFFGASVDPDNDDKVVFTLLGKRDVEALRGQLELDLGIATEDAPPPRSPTADDYGGGCGVGRARPAARPSMRSSQVVGEQVRSRAGRAATARRTARRVARIRAR